MWWQWLIFALIIIAIPYGLYNIKKFAIKRVKQTKEQESKANQRIFVLCLFYWLCDFFYMTFIINNLTWRFILGGLIMVIVFYNLSKAFISGNKVFSLGLIQDFIVGISLTVYLIYIIPNKELQEIIIPIIAAVYGGLLTLVGVAWTIKYTKNSSEKRENAKEMNARKSLIVILRETYNACLEQISWLDDTQIRGSVATKVDGNTPIKDEPFIKHLQELPFISSEKVIYSIENGLLSESELEAYIKIKNEYRHYISSRIIFFDIEQAKTPDQFAMKDKIVASKAALLSMIKEQISNLG